MLSPSAPLAAMGCQYPYDVAAVVIPGATGLGEGGASYGWNNADYEETWVSGREKLPPFWKPSPHLDLDSTGTTVNGEPTIFLMVASYRDFQCRETITSALSRATHPDRVVVAAVEQNAAGDVGCTTPSKPCEEDPTQPLCARRHQIRLMKVDAKSASG